MRHRPREVDVEIDRRLLAFTGSNVKHQPEQHTTPPRDSRPLSLLLQGGSAAPKVKGEACGRRGPNPTVLGPLTERSSSSARRTARRARKPGRAILGRLDVLPSAWRSRRVPGMEPRFCSSTVKCLRRSWAFPSSHDSAAEILTWNPIRLRNPSSSLTTSPAVIRTRLVAALKSASTRSTAHVALTAEPWLEMLASDAVATASLNCPGAKVGPTSKIRLSATLRASPGGVNVNTAVPTRMSRRFVSPGPLTSISSPLRLSISCSWTTTSAPFCHLSHINALVLLLISCFADAALKVCGGPRLDRGATRDRLRQQLQHSG